MPPLPPIAVSIRPCVVTGTTIRGTPAQPDSRGEGRSLEHGLVTDRDQWVPALQSKGGETAEERLLVREHLGGFAIGELLDVHGAADVTGHADRRFGLWRGFEAR